MFEYLACDKQSIIKKMIKDKTTKEIEYGLAYLDKLQVPFNSIEAFLCYKLQISASVDTALYVDKLLQLDVSEKYIENHQNEKEIYRKLFITLGSSIDVIIIKLASSLAYLKDNKSYAQNLKVRKVAKLSQDIYAPLCHRLGLGEMKIEFEDLSLYILNKEIYFEIANKLQLKKNERDNLIDEMINDIKQSIEQFSLQYKIFGRSKHIYSIYNKINTFDKGYDQLFDLLAIRVICKTKVDCYTILGLIHEKFPPLDNRFKDYIARPKANMYQSLHTTVKNEDGQIFEIQIRTEEMDKVAELGIAAHVDYKEGTCATQDVSKKLTNLKDFIANSNFETDDYKQILKQDILDDYIYTLTPSRKIISLPIGATVVDFAFKIHTRVGEKMIGALVNDKIVNYSHVLNTSDVVEILTKKNAPGPNEMWLDYCKTSHAKVKIKSYLKRKKSDSSEMDVERGKTLVLQELKKRKLNISLLDNQKKKNEFFKKYKLNSMYECFEAVATHKITTNELLDFFMIEKKATSNEIKFVKDVRIKNSVIIPGAEDIKYELAKCCYPVYGDKIIAKAKTGVAFKVHRTECKEVVGASLKAKWNQTMFGENKYKSNIKVQAFDNERLLNDIINVLSTANVGVIDVKKTNSSDYVTMVITISVVSTEQIDLAIANLKKNNLIKNIQRI